MGPGEVAAWQYFFVMAVVLVAALSMMASLVFSAFSWPRVDPAFRPAVVISSLLAAVGSSQALHVLVRWQDALGGPAAMNDAARFPVWFLTAPLALCGLVSVQRLKTGARGPVMALVVSGSLAAVAALSVLASSEGLASRLISGSLSALAVGAVLVAVLWWLPRVSPSHDPMRGAWLHATTAVMLGALSLSAFSLVLSRLVAPGGALLLLVHLLHAVANVALCAVPALLFHSTARVGMRSDAKLSPPVAEHEARGQHRAVGGALLAIGVSAVVVALVVGGLHLRLQLVDAATMAVFGVAVAVAGWWQRLQAREHDGPTLTSQADPPVDQPGPPAPIG